MDGSGRSGERLYGRRHGRPLNRTRRTALDAGLARFGLTLPPEGEGFDPSSLFGKLTGPLRLEIGFGNGEHLVAEAERYPQARMIGCEPFANGVSACMAALLAAGIDNVRVLPGDARPLLAALAPASLDRVVLLFPDPWPKKRHHKRRLIGPDTLPLLARAMQDGAEFRIATDVGDLAEWMREHLAASPEFVPVSTARLRPPDWPPTRYEAKALAKGLVPWYSIWRRAAR